MIVRHITLNDVPRLQEDFALLMGTFDGVHIGHQLLIKKAKSLTNKIAVLIIYTNKVVTKEHQTSGVLSTLDDRVRRFNEHSIDEVYFLNLGVDLLSLSPEEFIEKIILVLSPKYIIVGEDFKFGRYASGTPSLIQSYDNDDRTTTILKPLYMGEEKISTSLIKRVLIDGKPQEAKTLLGDYYRLTGLVTKGFGLGNKIGYPTANISIDPTYFLPRHGVYFVRVILEERTYFGMASLGYHPTVNEVSLPVLEVNIFDFNSDIYHHVLAVEFIEFLRDEEKYATVEALVGQIKIDREACYKLIEKGEF